VVWTTEVAEQPALLQDPLVKAMRSTREGRYVLAPNGGNDDLLYSMDWGSILSNRWALDQALPRIVRAADGDPATDPNA
jgi:iron complex transport system substrate-binding protein